MCRRPSDIPFTLPPRFVPQNVGELTTDENLEKKEEEERIKMDTRRDILAHRGSLSVRSRSLMLFVYLSIIYL